MSEAWTPVIGYEGLYEVSSQGRVRSMSREVVDSLGRTYHYRGRTLRQSKNSGGYRVVGLSRSGKTRTKPVHQLVARSFCPDWFQGAEILHWDDDKENNSAENLRWGTRSDNMKDRVRNGLHHGVQKTHCPREHPYSDENTYIDPARGTRTCVTCRTLRKREYRRTKRRTDGEHA